MIDGTKIEVRDSGLKNRLFYDPKLTFAGKQEWLSKFDRETIYTKETKQYKGILFCAYDNRLEILFSPHYYFNANKHNANDFTVKNCINVLNEFINEFDLFNELDQLKITNLEFGLNARSPIDVRDLITYAKYHQNKEFFNDNGLAYSKSSFKPNSNGRQSRYKTIKFYAKSIQYPEFSEPNLFRFEVKSKKSAFINQLGIYNLGDLINPGVYEKLKQTILNEFKGVLILDSSLSIQNLTKRQENKIKDYLNSDYWYRIKQRSENQEKKKNEFWYAKQRYFRHLDLAGYNIHKDLYRIISEKLDFLINEKGMFCPPIEKNEKGMFCPNSIVSNYTFLDFKV